MITIIGISTMNKKRLQSLVNSILSILFLISVLEAFTYSGFFVKYFSLLVGVIFFLMFVILFLIFNRIYETKFLKNVSFGLTSLIMFIYLLVDTLEKVKYPNYVFSHFHLHPFLLLTSVILITVIFLLNNNEKKSHVLLCVILFFVLVQYIIVDFKGIKKTQPLFILKNFGLSYDQKMGISIGKVPYDYIMFVKKIIPEDSTVLIPPQGYPWPQTGNVAYLRYFIYPRKLINGNEKDPKVDLKSLDFVLIDYGETTISEYGFTNVWPKFDVDGEYIIYWNPMDGTTQKAEGGKYVYESDTKLWGIIKIKK